MISADDWVKTHQATATTPDKWVMILQHTSYPDGNEQCFTRGVDFLIIAGLMLINEYGWIHSPLVGRNRSQLKNVS